MSDSVHEFYQAILGSHWTGTYGTNVDLRFLYASPLKREVSASLIAGYPGSDTGTMTVKIQSSPTSGDADTGWADITGATFTALTNLSTAALETIYFALPTGAKFIRDYSTIAGSAKLGWYGACILNMVVRQA